MTPTQRIQTVLRNRGREATTEQVQAWVEKTRRLFVEKKGLSPDHPGFENALADAVDAGQKTITMMLHLHFGDAM